MLDIKFVRENPDALDEAMANRQGSWDREKFFELDGERRAVITEVEELQAQRNAESKKIGMLMKEGKREEAEAAKEAVRLVNEKIEGLAARRSELEDAQYDFMARIPNMPCEATPVGVDENENPEVRRWGTPRDFAAEGFEGPRLTGTSVPNWAFWTLSAVPSSPVAVSPFFPAMARRSIALLRALFPQHSPGPRLQGVHPTRGGEPRDHVRHRPAAQVRG